MTDAETAVPVRALLERAIARLDAAGLACPRADAEWLVSHATGASRTALYLEELDVSGPVARQVLRDVASRVAGAPVQYVTGTAAFCGREFTVRPGVFIPRPETEAVATAVLDALRPRAGRVRAVELGTGSGCLAVTLAGALPACAVTAIEVSWTAIVIAQMNIRRHGVADRVRLVCGRGLGVLDPGCVVDAIIANPPYIPSGQVDRLPLDVRREPRLSLDGGPDGCRVLHALCEDAPGRLRPGGLLALECGEEQAAGLAARMRRDGWAATVQVVQDLAGRPRGVLATRRSGVSSRER